MSNMPKEALAIVAEMRKGPPEGDETPASLACSLFADRLESAIKREHELLRANIARVRELESLLDGAVDSLLGATIQQKQAGNAVAMRAALEEICRASQWGGSDFGNPAIKGLLEQLSSIRRIARDALFAGREPGDAPPNVGNAEASSGLPYAIIDGKPVAVLHGRVAKTPDGKIHDVVQAAPGNAAKLREALADCLHKMRCNMAPYEDTAIERSKIRDSIENARAALSAPPRNCDRFANGEEAWLAFERENPTWCADHQSKSFWCDDCESAGCDRCIAEWLFAPAKSEKGGDHADA